jgi:hypothetical protein
MDLEAQYKKIEQIIIGNYPAKFQEHRESIVFHLIKTFLWMQKTLPQAKPSYSYLHTPIYTDKGVFQLLRTAMQKGAILRGEDLYSPKTDLPTNGSLLANVIIFENMYIAATLIKNKAKIWYHGKEEHIV